MPPVLPGEINENMQDLLAVFKLSLFKPQKNFRFFFPYMLGIFVPH